MTTNGIRINPDGTQEVVEFDLPDNYFDDPVEPEQDDVDAKINNAVNAIWDDIAEAYGEGVNSI